MESHPVTGAIEETDIPCLKYNENGLIPAIAQDAETGAVLMMAWMNAEALKKTLQTGQAHYWSRSREELWHKGASSGGIQHVRGVYVDCDQDALLLMVAQDGGGACHTGRKTCFYRELKTDAGGKSILTFSKKD